MCFYKEQNKLLASTFAYLYFMQIIIISPKKSVS